MKKAIGMLICILLVCVCAAALADVEINATNFPDPVFREYVKQFDKDGDGKFSGSEIQEITKIDVPEKGISDLTGIGYFPALTDLCCNYNNLSSLDVSKNTALTSLDCSGNSLSVLDVSSNTALKVLFCFSNNLSSLDVSRNTALDQLDCGWNSLSSLNVSSNTALTSLYCDDNRISSLDVSSNTALTVLVCDNNDLTSLDISQNTALWMLLCYENNLQVLDVSKNTALNSLECYGNSLSTLDVSNCSVLADAVKNKQRMNESGEEDGFAWNYDWWGEIKQSEITNEPYIDAVLSVSPDTVVIAGDNDSDPDGGNQGSIPEKSCILTAATDRLTYDYADSVSLKAIITYSDGSTDGLAAEYPDASLSMTLIDESGEPVPGYIVQQGNGTAVECHFPLANDDMPAGSYKILVTSNVQELSVETEPFLYTADKSKLPDPSECHLALTVEPKAVTWDELLSLFVSVTDKDGNPARGIKVIFEILNPDGTSAHYFGDYDYLYNVTKEDGTCGIRTSKDADSGVKEGRYIVRTTIDGTDHYAEDEFELTGSGALPVQNGLMRDDDGIWRYYENGVFTAKTGLVEYGEYRYYVADGVFAGDFSGLAYADSQWVLIEAGLLREDYNGLYCDQNYGWWLVRGGQIDFGYTGLYCDENVGWWLIAGGQICWNYTGLYGDPNYGWWLINGGQICFDYNGLWCDPQYGWWLINGGTVDFGYTGLYCDANCGWWLIGGGSVCFDYNGLWGDPNYGWWLINGGTVDFGYTGLYCDANVGWWLVNGGTIDFGYNGCWQDPAFDWWLVQGGTVSFGYTGFFDDPNLGIMYVENGRMIDWGNG